VEHLDALTAARDAEAVRVSLGVPRLTWFAWTYASQVAQMYAQRYPHRVRAMVIDSPLDHAVSALTYLRTQVSTTEESFERFVAWCAATPPVQVPGAPIRGCVLHGQDVAAIYDDLIASTTEHPVPAPGVDHPLTGEEIAYLVMYALENGDLPAPFGGWVDLAMALQAAQQLPGVFGYEYPFTLGAAYYHPYRAVGCLDVANAKPGYGEFQALRREMLALAPRTRGVSDAWDYLSGCLGWPVPSRAPNRPVHVRGSRPILLVATRHNPLAPYPLAVRVAGQIERSTVLTYEGDAHIAFFNSACIRRYEQDYLLTGQPPAPGRSCPAGT
jgi:pimeloyl-ACP methyl ester carboxylesterase